VVSASSTPARASPEMDTPSFSATTGRGWGPFARSSTSHGGGSCCSAAISSRETLPSRNSAGVAGRWMPSFFAAVDGLSSWGFLRAVMAMRTSVRRGRPSCGALSRAVARSVPETRRTALLARLRGLLEVAGEQPDEQLPQPLLLHVRTQARRFHAGPQGALGELDARPGETGDSVTDRAAFLQQNIRIDQAG